jgi:hypothetical protein
MFRLCVVVSYNQYHGAMLGVATVNELTLCFFEADNSTLVDSIRIDSKYKQSIVAPLLNNDNDNDDDMRAPLADNERLPSSSSSSKSDAADFTVLQYVLLICSAVLLVVIVVWIAIYSRINKRQPSLDDR